MEASALELAEPSQRLHNTLVPTLHSRGQQLRQVRTFSGLQTDAKHGLLSDAQGPPTRPAKRPLLGGLYFSDLLVVSVSLITNLLRTCALAELLDIIWFGLVYIVFRLTRQMRARYKLSKRQMQISGSAPPYLFSVFVLCGARYILTRFPYLLPRITLAQETTGPLVQWRTGGAISQLVEIMDVHQGEPVTPKSSTEHHRDSRHTHTDSFRAYRLRGDRSLNSPAEPMQSFESSERKIVIMYLHGGGFALGSVALYAEALLRVLGLVHKLSQSRVKAECVAVEYDLAPTVRYPVALLQCLRCYAHLLEREHVTPEQIVLCGDSAGGGLILSMLLCLSAQAQKDPLVFEERDWSSLPLPARAVLISPVVDLRPRQALVFQGLRKLAAARDVRERRAVARKMLAQGTPGALDFLAPEALLHYAQLYAGVLERPRRAQGPVETLRKSLIAYISKPISTAPLRIACRFLANFLSQPLLRCGTSPPSQEPMPNYSKTCAPVVMLDDAQSDAVVPPGPLYRTTPLQGVQGKLQSMLATSPLLSPTLGDWSKVHLSHGIYVTYGFNEVLASDIDAWLVRLRTSWSASKAPGSVETYLEPGPSGIHVWPFVGMYLAGRQSERERGLRQLAQAILRVYPGEALDDEPVLSEDDLDTYEFGSPASMPSDYEEDHIEDRAAQLAWEQELMKMGVRT
ncbi:hypothetical protein MPSI1_000174 [Malassezia psittaci]|uniref:Alpha/beta hydrolase fold-3 domain-containing protein n=1 Tax=Malassezia psittaci TaxID=1821823 RepID=A0AAF0FAS3_9BASI|nr:hypothetical protein MPSI1_000174 [Malassezia psittaci]